jgi:hypothetical protein
MIVNHDLCPKYHGAMNENKAKLFRLVHHMNRSCAGRKIQFILLEE